MAEANFQVCPSHNLSRALLTGNSYDQTPFIYYRPTNVKPEGDGVYTGGDGGAEVALRLFLMPVCDGPAGAAFYMRLWGYKAYRYEQEKQLWMPYLLVELLCQAADIPGPAATDAGGSSTIMSQTENLCDAIGVTAGSVGDGEVSASGSNIPAYVRVHTRGAKLFRFEFQVSDYVGMNCFWARE